LEEIWKVPGSWWSCRRQEGISPSFSCRMIDTNDGTAITTVSYPRVEHLDC